MATWRDTINLIADGDAVNAQTINKVLLQFADRTQYLRDRFDAAATGEGLILSSRALASDVVEGDAVYYDSASGVFKRAIAAATDNDSGTLSTAASAYVVGIVVRKVGSELGDIGAAGLFKDVTVNDADSVALPAGHYYLSSSDAGKLVSSRPAVGVYVCQVTDDAIIVNPTPREVLEEHIHYKFDILTTAAGTVLCSNNNRVSVIYPEDVLGWLPADHSVFGDAAPQGAFFGYNLWQDSKLAALWPPEPVQSAYIELNGIGVAPDFVRVDRNGIWWMTDCADEVPFPPDSCISSSIQQIAESSSSGSPATRAPCDPAERRLTLWFTRMVAKTNLAVVTGLKAADGEPIVVSGCAEADADGYCQGKIELALNMLWPRTSGASGSEVVKAISSDGALSVGHVVEGVKGAGLITASGTRTLTGGYSAGSVTLTGLDPTAITRTLEVAVVSLDGAADSVYEDIVPFIGLVPSRENSFVGKVRIPTLSMTDPRLRMSFDFAMPIAGSPPSGITICYAKVSASDLVGESSSSLVGGSFATLPTAWSSEIDLSLEDLGSLAKGSHFRRNVYELSVSSDEIFLFRLKRAGSGGFTGELAIINMFATLYEG